MKHVTILQLKKNHNLLAFKKRKTCKAFIRNILPPGKQYRILKLEIQT